MEKEELQLVRKYEDLSGCPIDLGDFVVYSALWDRSAVLKYGLVKTLKTREDCSYRYGWKKVLIPTLGLVSVDRNIDYLDEKWTTTWCLQNKGREITLGFLDRVLVVAPDHVPTEARKLLIEAL